MGWFKLFFLNLLVEKLFYFFRKKFRVILIKFFLREEMLGVEKKYF